MHNTFWIYSFLFCSAVMSLVIGKRQILPTNRSTHGEVRWVCHLTNYCAQKYLIWERSCLQSPGPILTTAESESTPLTRYFPMEPLIRGILCLHTTALALWCTSLTSRFTFREHLIARTCTQQMFIWIPQPWRMQEQLSPQMWQSGCHSTSLRHRPMPRAIRRVRPLIASHHPLLSRGSR